jgi:hypothetical protein
MVSIVENLIRFKSQISLSLILSLHFLSPLFFLSPPAVMSHQSPIFFFLFLFPSLTTEEEGFSFFICVKPTSPLFPFSRRRAFLFTLFRIRSLSNPKSGTTGRIRHTSIIRPTTSLIGSGPAISNPTRGPNEGDRQGAPFQCHDCTSLHRALPSSLARA